MLLVRHDDGSFRRLLVPKDGGGMVAADGAERASIRTLAGGGSEVTIAGNTYRLPDLGR